MSLLALPNEIILQIAEYLLPADLSALLQLNRRLVILLSHVLFDKIISTRSPNLGALVLFSAAERDDWRVLHMLVTRGVLGFAGNGALLNLAVQKTRSERVVSTLLAYGVGADTRDGGYSPPWLTVGADGGHSPLWLAVEYGCTDIVRLLLQRKDVDPNVFHGHNSPVLMAARRNDLGMMRLLMANPRTSIAPAYFGEEVPLQIAIEKQYMDVVLLLLEDARVEVNVPFNTGWTPLHLAISTGNEELVRRLLRVVGISVNMQNHRGWTPLHQAVFQGHEPLVRMLLAEPTMGVNLGPPYHRTALHLAIQGKHKTLLQLLLADPRTDVNLGTPYHESPLHWAVSEGDLTTLRILLAHEDIDVDAPNRSGQTPLQRAAEMNRKEAVLLLLTRNVDPGTAEEDVLSIPVEIASLFDQVVAGGKLSEVGTGAKAGVEGRSVSRRIGRKFRSAVRVFSGR